MGLDISYFVNAKPAPFDGDCDDIRNAERACVERGHEAQADGIEHGNVFFYERSGCFRAGSYSGYGEFRDKLAALAGYPEADDSEFGHRHAAAAWAGKVEPSAPFYPLINFSDCEGTIGPETSARLAKDFADHQAKADAHDDPWFREQYARWRQAFEAVAGNGFVSFH